MLNKVILILLFGVSILSVPRITFSQSEHGFRFVRIKYTDTGSGWGGRRNWGPFWKHDYPTAEKNLKEAIERTTVLRVEGRSLILTLNDDRIFEYPILYLCEPGHWLMNGDEGRNLRKYFDRGGFVLFDDFAGRDWNNFYYNIKRIFPEREPVLLDPDHPVWTIYYDIDPVAAPSIKGRDRFDDEYYAVFDDDGRMMFLACYNQDIGDGWEHPFGRRVLAEASTVSFQMGINFIIYALTH